MDKQSVLVEDAMPQVSLKLQAVVACGVERITSFYIMQGQRLQDCTPGPKTVQRDQWIACWIIHYSVVTNYWF